MQKLSFVLFQLDEARRYIEDGRLAQLRLALLLLDNVAEVQMDRRINEELLHEEMQERIRSLILELPPSSTKDAKFHDILKWQPLSNKRKREISRYFDEKVKILSERWPHLKPYLVEPLKYLHKYRNEAYHYARTRPETINTAARLLLEINCDMLLSLYPRGLTYSSDDDYSWLEERFGPPVPRWGIEEFLPRAVDDIRSRASLSDGTIARTLAEHMDSRIQALLETLDFIADIQYPNRETAFRASLYFGEVRRQRIDPALVRIDNYEAQHQLTFIDELCERVQKMCQSRDRFEAFQRFSVLELDIEPIEDDVHELAGELDYMIQMEIDRRRDK